MTDLSRIPKDCVGLQLWKAKATDDAVPYERVVFKGGRPAVNTTLRRAAISGPIGPIGRTGEFWADFINEDGDWTETIALSREAWNALKNRWMRCRQLSEGRA